MDCVKNDMSRKGVSVADRGKLNEKKPPDCYKMATSSDILIENDESLSTKALSEGW